MIDAVLRPAPGHHLVHLDLLNPYSEKESLSDKLTLLDIKARDERGRWFNVEMQMDLGRALAARLLYYWAQLYGRQLVVGKKYSQLRPTISICFVNERMFPERAGYHRVFRLRECDSQQCLTDHEEIQVVEIPKFRRELEALCEPLDFWLYFFQNARELDADALPGPLARPEIRRAMEVLKVFSQSELERDRYENQVKAWRDHQARLRAFEEAVQERDQAVQERDRVVQQRDAVVQERDAAVQAPQRERDQAGRVGKQTLVEQIHFCQRLLRQQATPSDQLMAQSINELRSLADQLEQQSPTP